MKEYHSPYAEIFFVDTEKNFMTSFTTPEVIEEELDW